MSFKINVKIDDKKLRKMALAAAENHVVSIGVLGKNATRADGLNNVQIGIENEFGSMTAEGKPIPERSFLRIPLSVGIPKFRAKIAKAVFEGAATDDMQLAMDKIGNIGIRIVDDAFATRGGGTWRPNAKQTLKKKAPATEPLIWHGELRKSIAYEVSKT